MNSVKFGWHENLKMYMNIEYIVIVWCIGYKKRSYACSCEKMRAIRKESSISELRAPTTFHILCFIIVLSWSKEQHI